MAGSELLSTADPTAGSWPDIDRRNPSFARVDETVVLYTPADVAAKVPIETNNVGPFLNVLLLNIVADIKIHIGHIENAGNRKIAVEMITAHVDGHIAE